MLAVGYVRVSGRAQEVDGDSLTSQKKAIERYAVLNGYTLLDVISETFSGYYLRERKELAKIREMVRSKQVQVVIVNSFDRLSRETIHQAVLINEMMENNVEFVSVTEKIDQTPMGQMMRQMLGMVAAIEREKILERNMRGMDNRAEKGILMGTGRPKFGYLWGDEKHTHYTIHPIEGPIVRRMYEMYAKEGLSVRGIAIYLTGVVEGKWYVSTVARILSDTFYKGVAYNRRVKWVWVDGKRKAVPHPNPSMLPEGIVPPIVSPELWAAVAERRNIAKQDSPRNNKTPDTFLLRSGFAFCGYCGRIMNVRRRTASKLNPIYKCGAELDNCVNNPGITAHKLDTAVWDFVRDVLNDIDSIASVLLTEPSKQDSQATLVAIDMLIKQSEEEQERIIDDMSGVVGRARELLINKLNELEEEITKLKTERVKTVPDASMEEQIKIEVDNFLKMCKSMRGNFENCTHEEKRSILRHLGVNVKVYKLHDPSNPQYTVTIKPSLAGYDPASSQVGSQWASFLVTRTSLSTTIVRQRL